MHTGVTSGPATCVPPVRCYERIKYLAKGVVSETRVRRDIKRLLFIFFPPDVKKFGFRILFTRVYNTHYAHAGHGDIFYFIYIYKTPVYNLLW